MVDINQFLQQAQGMQEQMRKMQDEISTKEYCGKSGGGLITMKLSGNYDMKKITIDQSLLKESEKEMLEDLLVAAFNDAKHKVDADSKNSISNVFDNISLPPGMKMPF